MAITINLNNNFTDIEYSEEKTLALITSICADHHIINAQINIQVVDNSEMRQLNQKYKSSEKDTDCLSFDLTEPEEDEKYFDIIVNGQRAVAQATMRNLSSEAELVLYIVHGLLHNLGFDDLFEEDAQKMHQKEDEILQDAGFGIVYNKKKEEADQ